MTANLGPFRALPISLLITEQNKLANLGLRKTLIPFTLSLINPTKTNKWRESSTSLLGRLVWLGRQEEGQDDDNNCCSRSLCYESVTGLVESRPKTTLGFRAKHFF